MPYKTFNKNQFHYENGYMIDNQTGKTYTQSATNGNDVVILGLAKMPITNDATFVQKPNVISEINRGEITAKLNAARREHRQQVGAIQDDAEQAAKYLNEQLKEQPTIYEKQLMGFILQLIQELQELICQAINQLYQVHPVMLSQVL